MSLRVLLTCRTLARRSGSEAYVRDLALGLRRRGVDAIVYSPEWGPLAHDLKSATVPVVDDLARIAEPPVIVHGNHHPETMAALLAFPDAVGIHVVHGWNTAEATPPPPFPRLRRYVAVDTVCRERLISEDGVPAALVRVLQNPVDLARFQPRPPLPAKPRRALFFSNYARAEHAAIVRAACERHAVTLDLAGAAFGAGASAPEAILAQYDVVFAKARCALEALATGCAAVLCDATGHGPLVTADCVERLRRDNFGIRTLQRPLDVEGLAGEIARYDAADAERAAAWVRHDADLDRAVDELLALYDEVLAEHRAAAPVPREDELRAAARYLRFATPDWNETAALRRREGEARRALADAKAEADDARADLAAAAGTATWRLRERLFRNATLVRLYRSLRGLD